MAKNISEIMHDKKMEKIVELEISRNQGKRMRSGEGQDRALKFISLEVREGLAKIGLKGISSYVGEKQKKKNEAQRG